MGHMLALSQPLALRLELLVPQDVQGLRGSRLSVSPLESHELELALCWYHEKNKFQNRNGLNFLWSSTESSSLTAEPSCTKNEFKFKSYFAAL